MNDLCYVSVCEAVICFIIVCVPGDLEGVGKWYIRVMGIWGVDPFHIKLTHTLTKPSMNEKNL